MGLPIVAKIIDQNTNKSEVFTVGTSVISLVSGTLCIYLNNEQKGILITSNHSALGLIILGAFNALRISIIFPLIAKHVDSPKAMGVWFGIIKISENLIGCSLFFFAGDFYKIYHSYQPIIYACLGVNAVGVFASLLFCFLYGEKKEDPKINVKSIEQDIEKNTQKEVRNNL